MTQKSLSSGASWRRTTGWWMLAGSLALFVAALFVFPFFLAEPEPGQERFTLLQSFLGGTILAAIGLIFTAIKYWWTLMTGNWLPIALTVFVLLALLFSAIIYLA